MNDPFSPHIEATARHFWGDPNPHLSSANELRFGAHGSRSVDLTKGVWHDHEAGTGGGVLSLVTRETKLCNGDAAAYLRGTIGLPIPELNRSAGAAARPERAIVATYDYRDEADELAFQVVRYEPKDFRQRRPDGAGGWSWSVKGVRQVPYRLPELLEATALEKTVFVVEGEKDADALWALDVPATCNAGGAGKWNADLNQHFSGADIIIIPDNDDAGRNHARVVGAALSATARSVRVLELPGLALKGDVSDWVTAGGSADALFRLTERARPWAEEPPESRFGAILFSDIDKVTQRHDWLCDGMIFAGDVGLMYGASQSGKSFLSVDMGLSIARGVPFLGHETRRGGVIYQAGEGGKGLVPRLKAYRQYHGLYREELPFVLLPSSLNLFGADDEPDGIEAFIDEVLAFKAWLKEPLAAVFIDTWSTATPGANENASEDTSRSQRNVRRVQDAAGCAVMLIHHKNAAGDRPRGHTSLYANADTALEVTRDPEDPKHRTLHIAKVKDAEDGEKINFQLQPVDIGTYDTGKLITSCVVIPGEVGSPQAGYRKRLPPGSLNFLKWLDEAIQRRGGVVPPQSDRIPVGTQGVAWTDFREFYIHGSGATVADDKLRQALKRDGAKLVSDGLINRHGDWIWLTSKGEAYL